MAIKYIHLVAGNKVGVPELRKPVGAELGCVTPYIVTPGSWSARDLEYYADEVVAGLAHNAGHNCTKVELLITDAAWPQREAFLAALRCPIMLWARLRVPASHLHPLHHAEIHQEVASTQS